MPRFDPTWAHQPGILILLLRNFSGANAASRGEHLHRIEFRLYVFGPFKSHRNSKTFADFVPRHHSFYDLNHGRDLPLRFLLGECLCVWLAELYLGVLETIGWTKGGIARARRSTPLSCEWCLTQCSGAWESISRSRRVVQNAIPNETKCKS